MRERLLNSKVFVILIGANTRYLIKFVKWEMEQALSLKLPIVGVNLNGVRQQLMSRFQITDLYDLLELIEGTGSIVAAMVWKALDQRSA